MREGLARLTATLLLLGVVALALPDVISGFLDEPRGSLYTNPRDGIALLNGISFAGGIIVVLAVVVFVVNLAMSLAGGRDDDVDPWEGHTLEWSGDPSSVTVASATPLLDAREAATGGAS